MAFLRVKIIEGVSLLDLEKKLNEFFFENSAKIALLNSKILKENNAWISLIFFVDYTDKGVSETNDDGTPATSKQLYVLEKAGVLFPKGITKNQASALIKKIKETKIERGDIQQNVR